MGTKYDIESFLLDVETFIKANLNAKITEINTEKADSVTLAPLDDDDGYFQQMLDERIININPALWYGVSEFIPQSIQDRVAEGLQVFVLIIVADPKDGTMTRLMWRYQRALKEIFEEGWDKVSRFAVDLRVSNVLPNAVDLREFIDTSVAHKTMGVILEVHIP